MMLEMLIHPPKGIIQDWFQQYECATSPKTKRVCSPMTPPMRAKRETRGERKMCRKNVDVRMWGYAAEHMRGDVRSVENTAEVKMRLPVMRIVRRHAEEE